jgi:integral membrane sensor domain MASE1
VIRGCGAYLAKIALLAAVYVAVAKAAFALAFVHTSIAPVWLPSGIALAGVLLLGVRAAPGVWLGAFLFNATTPVPLWVSGAIALGNTLEAVAGAWLLHRAGFRRALDRVRDVLALGLLAAPVATVVSACVGTLELASTNGQGSVFWLELPRVGDPAMWGSPAPDASPAARGG